MPYTPAFSAKFAKPLLYQAVAIIQRDQAAALAAIGSDLPAIEEFHFGRGARTALPWLTLMATGPGFISNDDLSYREGWVTLQLTVDAAEFDQEFAQFKAHDYVRMLDVVLTSASLPDALDAWTEALPIAHETAPGGTTSPNAAGSVKDVIVTRHAYTEALYDNYANPIVQGTLTASIHLIEN